ncbi:MAG: hypothetical protein A2V66_17895 [Ignavibacteria bacterium RBG_13_36_8]|nr:MAG: hypothetical protein A2V66_17895 [Ignavibacteria bacterium RBG_13_36_8]
MSRLQNKIKIFLIVLLSFSLLFLICSCKKKEVKDGIIKVAVTISPYGDFISKIGGNRVNVVVLIPAGADPHNFEPSFNQLLNVTKANVYFRVGEVLQIENEWIKRIEDIDKRLKIIDCSKGINVINNNPHMWLGLEEVKVIIENIYSAMVVIDPKYEEYFGINKERFVRQIDSMDVFLKNDFQELSKREIIVYHPAWEYFTSHYGIVEIGIEKEGKNPRAGDLKELITNAKSKKVKAVFIEPQFDITSAKTIADEIGGEVVTINPLPSDFLQNLNDLKMKFNMYLK